MIRIEMLHEDEGHAGIGRQILQQLRERLQAAGGCADADYGERHATPPPAGGTGGGRVTLYRVHAAPRVSRSFLSSGMRSPAGRGRSLGMRTTFGGRWIGLLAHLRALDGPSTLPSHFMACSTAFPSPSAPGTGRRQEKSCTLPWLASSRWDISNSSPSPSRRDQVSACAPRRARQSRPAISSASLASDSGAEPSALLLALIQTLRPALKVRAVRRASTFRVSGSSSTSLSNGS